MWEEPKWKYRDTLYGIGIGGQALFFIVAHFILPEYENHCVRNDHCSDGVKKIFQKLSCITMVIYCLSFLLFILISWIEMFLIVQKIFLWCKAKYIQEPEKPENEKPLLPI